MCVIFISINSYSIDDFSSHEYRNFEKIQRNRFPLLLSKTIFSEIKKSAKAGTAPVFVLDLAFFSGLSTKSAVHLLF
ncbi:hypothetical protein C2L98_07185 [Enterococcus gallinarum]|nr:hypothetical protein C2L98_07185 [Enterococcus gallinarum]